MTGLARVVAVVLTLAVSGVPLVADWCALSCEVAHQSTQAAAPTCHHAASSTARLGQIPAPCSHDHHPVVVDAATTGVALRVVPAAAAPAASLLLPALSLAIADIAVDRAATSPPLRLTLASSLRI